MQILNPVAKMTSAPRWSYQLPTCLSSKLSSSVLSSCIPFVTLTFLTIAQSLAADKPACTTPTATQFRILKELEFSWSMHSKFWHFWYFRPNVNRNNQRPYIQTGELPTCLYTYEINFVKYKKLNPHFLSLISYILLQHSNMSLNRNTWPSSLKFKSYT